MSLFKIAFYMLLAAFIFHLLTKKYLNPFKLTMVVGKKGSGKTTWMVKLIYQHLRRGWTVYANIDIPGVHFFDPNDIGKFTFPKNSCVFVDEANIYWDNRGWKKTALELIQFYRYQRQYKVKMFLFSQTFDVDSKIRSLCDDLYLISNYARIIGYAKRIKKYPDLKQAEGESEARIVDMIEYDHFIFFLFGSRHLVYIPRWGKFFKTYNPPPLEIIPSVYIWDPDRAPRWLIRRRKLQLLVPVGRRFFRISDRSIVDSEAADPEAEARSNLDFCPPSSDSAESAKNQVARAENDATPGVIHKSTSQHPSGRSFVRREQSREAAEPVPMSGDDRG